MPRRWFQHGCIRITGPSWTLFYWQDQLRDGQLVRVKVSKVIGPMSMSKAEAQRAARPIMDEVNGQTEPVVKISGITLAEFIPEWRKHVSASLKPATVKGMESSIRAHLIPILGNRPLVGIDTKAFQDLITSMNGRARGTVENVYMDLQSILNAARRWHEGIPRVSKSELFFGAKKAGEGKAFFFTEKTGGGNSQSLYWAANLGCFLSPSYIRQPALG